LRELLEAGDLDLGVVEEWLILDALYTLVRSSADLEGDMPAVAEALVARLATLVPGSIPAILATMHYLSLARRWDQAEALMAGLEGTPAAAHPDIQFRRFELACARQQLSTASEIYRAHISTRALSGWEYASTLRFLAEAKLWPEAAATTRRMLEQGEAFPTGEHTLLQIIRRTASHRSMLAAIDGGAGDRQGGPGGGQKGWLAGFRQLLVDDLCVALGQVAVDDAAGRPLGVVSPANAFLVQPVPDPRQGAPERIAAFMCTNATYFLSALVFLASWARHRVATTTVDWYLFLDDDVPAAWDAIVAGFAERLSLPLRVQREQAFVPSGAELSESYGLFAGGHTLARAAYFRIYAAKHLMRTGLYRRAAYFDTDMLCRADLSDFFHLGLGGALIAARPEDQSAEVQEAATRNGLDPAQYFNSGVLLFDLSHPSMPERLERAVLVAELEPERLVFHDQCALNIAFAGATLLIEERFNHFLRPHRDDNGDPSASALVHFLDRPKPWDVTYVREYRAGWVAAAGMVRALLSPADYGAIAAVANGQKPARPVDPPPSLSLASQDGGRA
jgi:lipopolysaccharide biosynthesis glycosyltransferase